MSIRPVLAGALLTTAAATATALSASPAGAATGAPTTTVEKGVVIECTGHVGGQDVYVSLYENNRYANVVQVNIGEDGASRQVRDIVRGGRARAGVRIDGSLARVAGAVRATGRRSAVHEEMDDAGQHIVTDGTHRALRTRLHLSFRSERSRLTCENSFRYRLRVTKTPIV
jgi:hypothetical protein